MLLRLLFNQFHLSVFALLLFADWQSLSAADPTPVKGSLPSQPDYAAVLQREWVEAPDWARFNLNTGWRLDRFTKSDPRRIALRIQEAWEAYELTGNAKYARLADQLMKHLTKSWQDNPRWLPGWCFFTQEPLLKAATGLQEKGALSEEAQKQLAKFSRLVANRQLGTDNQALSRQAGVAQAIHFFPESKSLQRWQRYLNDGWAQLLELEDFDENATGYNAIGLRAALEIAERTGKQEDLKRPGLRRAFERYRDLQTPSGSWPEYGDHYFGNDLDIHALEAMEKAARLYQDPTFLTAAWKHFWRTGGNPPHLRTRDSKQASTIEWVKDLGEPAFAPQPLEVGSLITLRHTPNGRDQFDKMVLAPNREPGSPYVLLDLYNAGYHAHQNRRGAVLYYEADGIPLFHGLSRHATGAEHANMVILRPAGEPFPMGRSALESNVWKTASFPTRDLEAVGGGDGLGRQVKELTFRVDPFRTKGLEIFVDNLRLEGPAGVRTLEDFEESARGLPRSTESTSGKSGARLPAGQVRQKFWRPTPAYDVNFSTADYTELKFDWKYRAKQDGEFSFLFRVPGIHNGPIRFLNDAPELKLAKVTEGDGASYGQLWLEDYMAPGTQLRRELLLLDEGPLLIRDTLVPAESAAGMTGGPIWHLYALRARGWNWFAGGETGAWPYPQKDHPPFAPRELLVAYAPQPDQNYGQMTSQVTSFQPTTTFASTQLEPGKVVQFLTVLLPYAPSQDPAALAQAIAFDTAMSDSRVDLPLSGGRVSVVWKQDGSFSLNPTMTTSTSPDSS